MATEAYQPGDPGDELELVLAGYLRAAESGARPQPEQLIARHPHLAAELRDFFANHARMERMSLPLRTDPPPRKVQSFGAYELLEEIGRGGMGIIYKARHRSTGRLVALKRMRTEFATPADVQRFRNEAEQAANLDHPNIVPIYEVGEHEGQPYFSMKLIEGGNLAQRLHEVCLPTVDRRSHRDSTGKIWSRAEIEARRSGICRLVATVARAVHHAHQRRILHRDLKPANILLSVSRDAPAERSGPERSAGASRLTEVTPHITDFGLAKRVEEDTGLTQPGIVVGTPTYMAPEQAAGVRVLTTAVDVYNLGIILYELLTGRPPFRGTTSRDVMRQLLEQEPASPRTLNPLVDRDLETICLKCLEKDPAHRYGSAEALADDLERILSGRHPLVRRPGALERLGRWRQRNPTAALAALAAVGLLVMVTFTALRVAHQREARLRREVLDTNQEMAGHVASTVLVQLEHLSRPVIQTAELPRLRGCLESGRQDELQQLIASAHQRYADPRSGFTGSSQEPPFKSWYVLDLEGKILAVSPNNPDIQGEPFAGRDYFQGALRRQGQTGSASVHVSRIFRAVNDGLYKFALSAPIHDEQGRTIGVLAATIPTASTTGTLHLATDRRRAVLAGRADTGPREGPAEGATPEKYLILLHPSYQRPGRIALEVTSPALEQVQRRPHIHAEELDLSGPEVPAASDEDYRDPAAELDAAHVGRWLAGFAPVGNTELVVIVQQRYDEALGLDRALGRELLLPAGIVLALGLVLVGALVRLALERRR